MLKYHHITSVEFPKDADWSDELHEHLLGHVAKKLQGALVPMGQAEVLAREAVDKEMRELTAKGQISFANGQWVFARAKAPVVSLADWRKKT